MPILCLHGIAQEENTPEGLHKLWTDSIVQGFDNAGLAGRKLSITLPYYGDLLAALVPANITVEKRDNDLSLRAGDIRLEVESTLQPKVGRSIANRDDKLRGPGKDLVQLVTKALSSSVEARLIDYVLKQVEGYLTSATTRASIVELARSSLQNCIRERSCKADPIVVLAHSLGSVVAVDMLADWNDEEIDFLVTIGSPLSIKGVNSRLSRQPPQWPRAVTEWLNFADREDIVALNGAIDRTNFFAPIYRGNHHTRCDVLNVLDVRNHMKNHHGIAGYLDDPVFAQILWRKLNPIKENE